MTAAPLVVRVQTPEKGRYSVRCPDGFVARHGGRVVVKLDYGLDIAEVVDERVHSDASPAFSIVRLAGPEDAIAIAANESRARAMREVFREAARKVAPDVRVPYARLSLGGERLFVRYVCESRRLDPGKAILAVRKECGVAVNAWQVGPRDEVRLVGALGPCGRACCCAAWQHKYPGGLAADAARQKGQNPTGACGMFKCCLAFERED